MIALFASAGLALAAPEGGGSGGEGRLRVTLTQLRNDHGVVRCALHGAEDTFPRNPKKGALMTVATIAGGEAVCVFDKLRPGVYAVAAYHDENDNDNFDRAFYGKPLEGHAASNDATGAFGPKWKDARFDLKPGPTELRIKMIYN